jgi:hypothetical protein
MPYLQKHPNDFYINDLTTLANQLMEQQMQNHIIKQNQVP